MDSRDVVGVFHGVIGAVCAWNNALREWVYFAAHSVEVLYFCTSFCFLDYLWNELIQLIVQWDWMFRTHSSVYVRMLWMFGIEIVFHREDETQRATA